MNTPLRQIEGAGEPSDTASLAAEPAFEATGRARCLIDGYNLGLAHGTGVKSYARNLADTLATEGQPADLLFGRPAPRRRSPDSTAASFFSPEAPRRSLPVRIAGSLRGFATGGVYEVESAGRVATEHLDEPLPRHARLLNAHLLYDRAAVFFRATGRRLMLRLPSPPAIAHWTYPLPIGIAGALNVYTLHDLIPLTHPWTSSYDKVWFEKLVRHLARHADHLVAVSHSTEREVRQRLEVPAERITTTYQSAATAFRPGQELARLRTLFGLAPRGYFLFVSAIEPHKNLWRVIQANAALGARVPLVIVGRPGLRSEEYLASLPFRPAGPYGQRARLPNGGTLLWLQRLPLPLLAELMAGALALVQPSLTEGFGLPALEAMQSGTPVITADGSGAAEITAGAALTVEPTDVGQIAQAMALVAGDEAVRRDLAERGLRRAQDFAPARYGRTLRTLYDRLLAAREAPPLRLAQPPPARARRGRQPTSPAGRLERFFQDHLLVHTHVEKSGGTSFTAALVEILGRRHVLDLRGSQQIPPAALNERERAAVWALTGHFQHGDHVRHFHRAPLSIAITRDPLERFFSFYRFVRTQPSHPQHAEIAGRCFEAVVEDFLERRHHAAIDYLARKVHGTLPCTRSALLRRAEHDFFLVAPQEQLDAVIALLWRTLGEEPPPPPLRHRVGIKAPLELSAAGRRRFEAANALDYALHAYVTERAPRRLFEAERRLSLLLAAVD